MTCPQPERYSGGRRAAAFLPRTPGPTSRPTAVPDRAEAEEICQVARAGGVRAGATGAVLDDVVGAVAETITAKWGEPHMVRARSRPRAAWHAYIRVCARNAYRDIGRTEGRRWAREQRSLSPTEGAPPTERPGVVRQSDEPPSNLERYLARRQIVDLLEECLEGRSRQVAALQFIDGLTTAEIAELLGLSIGSVNRIKRGAITRLKAAVLSEVERLWD